MPSPPPLSPRQSPKSKYAGIHSYSKTHTHTSTHRRTETPLPSSPSLPFASHTASSASHPAASQMGRYVSVQAYSDQNTKVASVPYEKAKSEGAGGGGGGGQSASSSIAVAGPPLRNKVRSTPIYTNIHTYTSTTDHTYLSTYNSRIRTDGQARVCDWEYGRCKQ